MKTAESHNAELTGRITFVEMPPIPEEAHKFLEQIYEEAKRISGVVDAKTQLHPDVPVEGQVPSA